MKPSLEGSVALMIAGIIVIALGGILLLAVPVTSGLRAGVALVTPLGAVIIVVGLAFWLDDSARYRKRSKRG